jgi:hypothetical protein
VEETTVNEVSRTYVYSGNAIIKYPNVETLRVSASGNHYLKYRPFGLDSSLVLLAVVAPGWRAIDINPGAKADWTC